MSGPDPIRWGTMLLRQLVGNGSRSRPHVLPAAKANAPENHAPLPQSVRDAMDSPFAQDTLRRLGMMPEAGKVRVHAVKEDDGATLATAEPTSIWGNAAIHFTPTGARQEPREVESTLTHELAHAQDFRTAGHPAIKAVRDRWPEVEAKWDSVGNYWSSIGKSTHSDNPFPTLDERVDNPREQWAYAMDNALKLLRLENAGDIEGARLAELHQQFDAEVPGTRQAYEWAKEQLQRTEGGTFAQKLLSKVKR